MKTDTLFDTTVCARELFKLRMSFNSDVLYDIGKKGKIIANLEESLLAISEELKKMTGEG